jgi:hypothetical protein
VRIVRTKLESKSVRASETVGGKAGVKVAGSGGFSNQDVSSGDWGIVVLCTPGVGEGGLEGLVGERREGPLRSDTASRMMLWRRCSWELMKGAEFRSPVQRVMSTQSRDSLRRVRSWERVGRMRGWSEER